MGIALAHSLLSHSSSPASSPESLIPDVHSPPVATRPFPHQARVIVEPGRSGEGKAGGSPAPASSCPALSAARTPGDLASSPSRAGPASPPTVGVAASSQWLCPSLVQLDSTHAVYQAVDSLSQATSTGAQGHWRPRPRPQGILHPYLQGIWGVPSHIFR